MNYVKCDMTHGLPRKLAIFFGCVIGETECYFIMFFLGELKKQSLLFHSLQKKKKRIPKWDDKMYCLVYKIVSQHLLN